MLDIIHIRFSIMYCIIIQGGSNFLGAKQRKKRKRKETEINKIISDV